MEETLMLFSRDCDSMSLSVAFPPPSVLLSAAAVLEEEKRELMLPPNELSPMPLPPGC